MQEFRGLEHHLMRWGPDSGDPVLLLHGYADCAASFQFIADEIAPTLPLVAIDWRGFGLVASARPAATGFRIITRISSSSSTGSARDAPARLVGHSMGANVAMIYAGVRPRACASSSISRASACRARESSQAPDRLGHWLDQQREAAEFADYADVAELAARIVKRNPRLPPERAAFVAAAWSGPRPDGGVRLLTDPAHRMVNPYLYRREEMEACWRRIEAPVLLVIGADSDLLTRLGAEGGPDMFKPLIRELTIETVAGAGHMLHHEEPRAVARLIENFLGTH